MRGHIYIGHFLSHFSHFLDQKMNLSREPFSCTAIRLVWLTSVLLLLLFFIISSKSILHEVENIYIVYYITPQKLSYLRFRQGLAGDNAGQQSPSLIVCWVVLGFSSFTALSLRSIILLPECCFCVQWI